MKRYSLEELNKIAWTQENQGPGSGLDADTLDGKQASDFVLVTDYEDVDVLNKIKNVDGTGSGLDADTVDGLHATDILNGTSQSVSATNLATGWYTVAVNNGNRAIARFGIRDRASSRHGATVFYAAHFYGNDSSNDISVIIHDQYSSVPYRYIRIKEGGTYDGAVLQIYIDDSINDVSFFLLGDNFQENGWILKNWIPDSTDPGDVSNYNSMTEKTRVDLDKISTGGIITTGQIYAGGQTNQYIVWHQGNDGSGSGLDADMVDGLQASQFVRSDVDDTVNGVLSFPGNGNRIVFQPSSSGSSCGIRFNSKVNSGSDYGYITWYDDNNSYNFWGDSVENGALVIGVENDGQVITSDVVALKSPAAVVNDSPVFYSLGNIFSKGDLTIDKNHPWITVKSSTTGTITNEQAAGISIGEGGQGSASIHITYTGDGYGHIGMGAISNSVPTYEAMTLHYLNRNVIFRGDIILHDYNTQIQEGGNNSLRFRTNYGYVDIGPQNSSYCHLATDRGVFYFNKSIQVNGRIQRYGYDSWIDAYDGRIDGATIERWKYFETSSNTNAQNWGYYIVDTSGGEVTITLPPSPANYARVFIVDMKGTFGSNNCIVARNGKKIMGLNEDLRLNVNNYCASLIYIASQNDWRLTIGQIG